MISLRKVFLLSLLFFAVFVSVVQYFMSVLSENESEVRNAAPEETYEKKILQQLARLPEIYYTKSYDTDNLTDLFLKNLQFRFQTGDVWKTANDEVSKNQLYAQNSSSLGGTIHALKTFKVTKADLDSRGTQLKLLLTLEGDETVIFKPQWYPKDRVIEGPVYAGKDRYGSEILGFYLSGVLNVPRAPISVPRTLRPQDEILPVATKRLLSTTFRRRNSTCFYGSCFYCKKEDPVCEIDGELHGAVIFNVGAPLKTYRSPWQRTYKQSKRAVWETQNDYCRSLAGKVSKHRLYDLVDTSIFDFLLQNGDRHHYETLHENVVWIDNGKGLGNPYVHHVDILAPLYQCCVLRTAMWNRLRSLAGGLLTESLRKISDVTSVVTDEHLKAIEERLLIVFATVEFCRNRSKAVRGLF